MLIFEKEIEKFSLSHELDDLELIIAEDAMMDMTDLYKEIVEELKNKE